MQIELKRIQQRTGITFIYVTHDQEEALTMSDRVVVMNHGVIQQVGSPTDIYNEPVSAFVADFIGEINIIDGVMLGGLQGRVLRPHLGVRGQGLREECARSMSLSVRRILKSSTPATACFQGVVESIVFKGVHYEMMVRTQFFTFMVHSTMAESVGKTVGLTVIPFDIHIMHKKCGGGSVKKSFAYPYGVWLAVFILAPILMVVVYAFLNGRRRLHLCIISAICPASRRFSGRSFWLAFLSTVVCLVLGYPMAYLMSRLSASRQSL